MLLTVEVYLLSQTILYITYSFIMMLILVALCLLLCFALHLRNQAIRRRMPPGPPGYPFIGNVLDIDPKHPMKAMSKWAKEYGPVFTIQVFGNYMVVANELSTIQVSL